MGKHYDQFDLDDRIEISRLHADGISRRAIGRMMGRSASTISRELRRNSLPKGGYKPASADRIALSRRRRLSRIERLSPLGDHVRHHLAMGWSPEQIAGRLRRDGLASQKWRAPTETGGVLWDEESGLRRSSSAKRFAWR